MREGPEDPKKKQSQEETNKLEKDEGGRET